MRNLMTKVTIKLTRPDDPAVRDLINRLLAGPTVLMAVTLFGGDRWSCVRDVALALDRTGRTSSGCGSIRPTAGRELAPLCSGRCATAV